MRELSMHILDIAQNSIAAEAKRIEIEVSADTDADLLTITIADDGRGMPEELLAVVEDPFTTTRTTRRVGLGLPMLGECARACEGFLKVDSEAGKGTRVEAAFRLGHIDRIPLGNITATLVALIAGNPDVAVRYTQRKDGAEFVLDTDRIRAELDGVPINELPVLKWLDVCIRQLIDERAPIS